MNWPASVAVWPAAWRGRAARAFAMVLAALMTCVWLCATRANAATFLQQAAALRNAAAQEAASGCATPADSLVRILCEGRLTVGVRGDYAGFSSLGPDGRYTGFEVDVAQEVARFLGVPAAFVRVSTTDRIPKLAAGAVDLVIATMGHNLARDAQIRFIRPHYFMSETAVVGGRADGVTDWQSLAGRTVCIPIGASSNAMFVKNQVRILIFDEPGALLDALKFNVCSLIVHDDTFFTGALGNPKWRAQYAIKFGFAPIPWGMAVARDGGGRLGALLDALSAGFHAEGVFMRLAAANQVRTSFLEAQRDLFAAGPCSAAAGPLAPQCLIAPVSTVELADQTRYAGQVTAVEDWLKSRLGITLPLAPLKDRNSVALLADGIVFSVVLIAGALVSTLLFALLFGALLCGHAGPAGRVAGRLSLVAQTTPMSLMLFFGYIIASGVFQYSGFVAMLVAVAVIGLFNGSYAGQAMHDAYAARVRATGVPPGLWETAALSGTQLAAFLINAAKGSPAAGMIGAPEFLNTLTDLTSYTSNRMFVYVVLLLFYSALVLLVIWLTEIIQRTVLAARVAPA